MAPPWASKQRSDLLFVFFYKTPTKDVLLQDINITKTQFLCRQTCVIIHFVNVRVFSRNVKFYFSAHRNKICGNTS